MQNLEQSSSLEWVKSAHLIPYESAMEEMALYVDAIQQNAVNERIWLLEHEHVFTKGTSGEDHEALNVGDVPLMTTRRGGRITYHGPGQRVGYMMLDLRTREKDVRLYVQTVEAWLIETLRYFSLDAFTSPGRIGIWVRTQTGEEAKIASIGIRLQKWVSSHGFALNVNPDLTYFKRIIPCGIEQYGVTSLHHLGVRVSIKEVDDVLQKTFRVFF